MERPSAKSFTDLLVWRKAHQLVLHVYKNSAIFPANEIYGLTSQFRRAAVSVPANIAEGFKRRGKQDKRRFLNIAQASLEECRYYLILVRDLNYASDQGLTPALEEVSKMLDAYVNAIRD